MRNAAWIIAAALIVAGTALIYLPAGIVAAGMLLGLFVYLTD